MNDSIRHAMDPSPNVWEYGHLPPRLRSVSKPFGDLANIIITNIPPSTERSFSLRKLLEAKDCAVRASLSKQPDE